MHPCAPPYTWFMLFLLIISYYDAQENGCLHAMVAILYIIGRGHTAESFFEITFRTTKAPSKHEKISFIFISFFLSGTKCRKRCGYCLSRLNKIKHYSTHLFISVEFTKHFYSNCTPAYK